MREAFEAYARSQKLLLDWCSESRTYWSTPTRLTWEGWQACASSSQGVALSDEEVFKEMGRLDDCWNAYGKTRYDAVKLAVRAMGNISRASTSRAEVGSHPDTARLDFLSSREAWIAWSKDGEVCRVFHRNDEGDTAPILGWKCPWFGTAREAIDAAMQAAAEAPNEKKDG